MLDETVEGADRPDAPPAPPPGTRLTAAAIPAPEVSATPRKRGRPKGSKKVATPPTTPSEASEDPPADFPADGPEEALVPTLTDILPQTISPTLEPTVIDGIDIAALPKAWRDLLLHGSEDDLKAIAQKIEAEHSTRKLENYCAYPKQRAFHTAGASFRERLFQAGNQQGKSFSACVETTLHLTGLYHLYQGGWEGRQWDRPTRGWALGETNDSIRESLATLLLGPPGQHGTGLIPRDLIVNVTKQQGVADAIDTVQVRHVSGGISTLSFKSYAGGVDRLMGASLDFAHLDESPDPEIYTEVLSRTNATGGMIYMTATPLKGLTEVVQKFYPVPTASSRFLQMSGIEDALHIPPERRQEIIDSYPSYERDARLYGIPMLGSGRVFDFGEELVRVQDFPIPPDWKQIVGLDWGINHPFACAKLAFDPNSSPEHPVVYVTRIFRQSGMVLDQMASAVRSMAGTLPVAYPHDVNKRDPGSGQRFADILRNQGLNMLAEPARFPDQRGNNPNAGVEEIKDKMLKGEFKVFASCEPFWEEFRLYHRKDGKLTETKDDAIDATRYGYVAGLRFAEAPSESRSYLKPLKRAVGYGGNWRRR